MRSVLLLTLVAFISLPAMAQRHQEAWELMKIKQLDTARAVADADVSGEGKDLAMSWYVRGMIYKSIYDREDYNEKHPGEYIDLVAFDSYKQAIKLDENNKLTGGILEDVHSLTEDFVRTGLDLFEKGYEARNAHQLSQAARYLDAVSEAFDMLGPRQVTVHKSLLEYGIDRKTLEVCRALSKDNSGKRKEAAKIYEQLVIQKTNEPAVYLSLKEYYATQGQRNKAIQVLEQGRKQAPKSMEVALAYAELLADTNRANEGMAIAKSLSRSNPESAAPLAAMGFIEEKRQNADKAQAYYEQALELEPHDFITNFRLGKLYFKKVEENRAKRATQLYIKELEQKSLFYAELASQQDPKHPGNCRIMLELYTALGQNDKAELLKTMMN